MTQTQAWLLRLSGDAVEGSGWCIVVPDGQVPADAVYRPGIDPRDRADVSGAG